MTRLKSAMRRSGLSSTSVFAENLSDSVVGSFLDILCIFGRSSDSQMLFDRPRQIGMELDMASMHQGLRNDHVTSKSTADRRAEHLHQ